MPKKSQINEYSDSVIFGKLTTLVMELFFFMPMFCQLQLAESTRPITSRILEISRQHGSTKIWTVIMMLIPNMGHLRLRLPLEL
jgi:hypothetical protein